MSGGVDSAYSAYLLKQQGYRVVGFTFDLLPAGMRDEPGAAACRSPMHVNRARKIAADLGIPHYVLDLREEFERHVIDRFVNEYREGRTPNPCVLCNQHIKFASFVRRALAMGADRVATGHYACLGTRSWGPVLMKGEDSAKDQSYFLYPIRREDLGRLAFPLASYTKERVQSGFKDAGGQADLRESQDICFIPGNDYRRFIGRFIPGKEGPVILADGRHIGRHDGVHLYTVGQRRGIDIPYTEALYVVELRAGENTVVVGPKEMLRRDRLSADEVNMLAPVVRGEARAKIRYRQKEEPCAYSVKDGVLEIDFHRPVFAVSPGQSVVLYDGDIVLGGGTIRDASTA